MTIEKEEWIARCKAQYAKRAGLTENEAQACAEVSFDEDGDDDDVTPEEAADNDMDCWDDDGE
ncbi:MAG: hypothetical protein JWN23_1129 [Rhodocyclales bacterium]|nr:hypothetical protein [Rhodocyclales bacterium]